MSDFFKFEDVNIDFPFYNGIPQLNTIDWLILIIALLLETLICNLIPGLNYIPSYLFPFIYCLVLLIPILYVCKGNYGSIFSKPRKEDIKVIVLCFIAYFIFSVIMSHLLSIWGVAVAANPRDSSASPTILLIVSIFVQLMGEELFKVVTLILFMALSYHFTKNRKISMIVGIVISCLCFGLIHMGTYGNLAQCLLIVGVGCIFHLYPYLKTKNIMNSYLTHVLIDIIGFVPLIFGLGLI